MPSDTRNRILAAAARLFEANGFEGTSVAAILRAADVNSGSLYHFFASKEALLEPVLRYHLASLGPTLLEPAAGASEDPVERVFALLELYRGRLIVSGFTRGCPVADLLAEIGNRHEEARKVGAVYFERWAGQVRDWMAPAMSPGRADALGRLILAVTQGAITQARASLTIERFDELVSELRLVLRAFLARRESADATAAMDPEALSRPAAAVPRSGAAVENRTEGGEATDPSWWKAW